MSTPSPEPQQSITLALFVPPPAMQVPRFALGGESDVPLRTARHLTPIARRTLESYGLWSAGHPVTEQSKTGRVREMIAMMIRRHAVYATRENEGTISRIMVGFEGAQLHIRISPGPDDTSVTVTTWGTFAEPRTRETQTAVHTHICTRLKVSDPHTLYPCNPIQIHQVMTALAYAHNGEPRTHSKLIEMIPPPPEDDLCGCV